MDRRQMLKDRLESILGSENTYFQPPESVRMQYPCIVYRRANDDVQFADDSAYIYSRRWEITVIDPDPDTQIPDRVCQYMPMCISDRNFTADNLNHYVYNLYF